MPIASLPMYDLPGIPELRKATDRWWAAIAGALRAEGVAELPGELARPADLDVHWRDPDLLLSQCCGYPLTHALSGWHRPIGTPCYSAPGCEGPDYSSVIVVRAAARAECLSDLKGKVAAYSSEHSHSGYNALRRMVAPLAEGGRFFSQSIRSGGHLASIAMVAEGKADVAAVDCITYALLDRYRPRMLAGLRQLGYTIKARGMPYVTRANAAPDLVGRLCSALRAAARDPALAAIRDALLITNIVFLAEADYAGIREIEDQALRLGYPRLA